MGKAVHPVYGVHRLSGGGSSPVHRIPGGGAGGTPHRSCVRGWLRARLLIARAPGGKGGRGELGWAGAGPKGCCGLGRLWEISKKIETGRRGHRAELKEWIGRALRSCLRIYLGFKIKGFKIFWNWGLNWGQTKINLNNFLKYFQIWNFWKLI
jgi:hypothetical protein